MKAETVKAINATKNLGEYFQALHKHFNLKECKPGKFLKSTFIFALTSKLGNDFKVSETTKQKALDTENMEEFISLIESNYNTKAEFSPQVRATLSIHTETFQKMIQLKEN